MCYGLEMKDNHTCIKNRHSDNCPICLEGLHASRKSTTMFNCGHSMHRKCLKQYYKANNMACPTCKKSLFDQKLIEQQYDNAVE